MTRSVFDSSATGTADCGALIALCAHSLHGTKDSARPIAKIVTRTTDVTMRLVCSWCVANDRSRV